MRVDIAKLKGAIVANGMTQEQLAKEIGVDSSTLSRKMQLFGATFTIGEIHRIASVLRLSSSEAAGIFLAKDLQKCE